MLEYVSFISVIQSKSQCSSPYHVTATSTSQVLSSDVTRQTGCGSEAAPWVIQARPGQKIKINLIDFYWSVDESQGCEVKYGYIVDGETSAMLTICGGTERNKHLQVSVGDMTQVVIKHEVVEEYRFLLEYFGLF